MSSIIPINKSNVTYVPAHHHQNHQVVVQLLQAAILPNGGLPLGLLRRRHDKTYTVNREGVSAAQAEVGSNGCSWSSWYSRTTHNRFPSEYHWAEGSPQPSSSYGHAVSVFHASSSRKPTLSSARRAAMPLTSLTYGKTNKINLRKMYDRSPNTPTIAPFLIVH